MTRRRRLVSTRDAPGYAGHLKILIYLPNELSKSTVRPSGALFTVFEAVLVSTAGCGATAWTGL